MAKILECVPNISEGRNSEVIEAVVDVVRHTAGVALLDYSSDPSHNRTVITFLGEPQTVAQCAIDLAGKAVELIDLTKHQGEHPRMGAVDVIPFIPIKEVTKEEAVEIGRRFERIGYRIFATRGTAEALKAGGVKANAVNKIEQESPNLMDLILGHKIDLVIDTPPQGADRSRDGFVIRRNAIETGVNVLTAIDTAKALITSLENTDIKKLTLIDIARI